MKSVGSKDIIKRQMHAYFASSILTFLLPDLSIFISIPEVSFEAYFAGRTFRVGCGGVYSSPALGCKNGSGYLLL